MLNIMESNKIFKKKREKGAIQYTSREWSEEASLRSCHVSLDLKDIRKCSYKYPGEEWSRRGNIKCKL